MSTTIGSSTPIFGSLGTSSDAEAEKAHVERFYGQIFVLLIVWFCFNVVAKVIDIAAKFRLRRQESVRYRLQSSAGASLAESVEFRGAYALSHISQSPDTQLTFQGIKNYFNFFCMNKKKKFVKILKKNLLF